MRLALLTVIVVGAAIGFRLPVDGRRVAAPPRVAATVAPPANIVLDRQGAGHFIAVAQVNGEPVRFVVDTGADVVALTVDDARRAHVLFDPVRFAVIGRGASGPVRGEVVELGEVALDGRRAGDITGVVLENSAVSLLGQSYLRRLASVEIKGDVMTLR